MMRIQTDSVLRWAINNVATFRNNPCGPHRKFNTFDVNSCPQEVLAIKDIIVNQFELHDAQQEPIFKDFCGFITEGGYVHKHKDPNQGQLIHTRFNVMVSKPVEGGVAVIDGQEVSVEEGEVWRCDAGICEHWTTPVIGSKPRIILSFGFLL